MLNFMVCENLHHDVLTAVQALEFNDICVSKFPARCGHPQVTWAEMETVQNAGPSQVIFGCHCISNLSSNPHPAGSFQIEHVQQCLYLFCPQTLVDNLQQQGACVLTPGWLAGWTRQVELWGFDHKTAIEFFKDSTNKLVLMDTGTDKTSFDTLQSFAAFLNKPCEVIPIGLEYHEMLLAKKREEYLHKKAVVAKETAEKLAADYALVQDVLHPLPQAVDEVNVIKVICDFFSLLMAPENTLYIPATNSRLLTEMSHQQLPVDIQLLKTFYLDKKKEYLKTDNGNSLYLKIQGLKKVAGIVKLTNLSFPEYTSHYLNIALNVTPIFGLAIEHARTIKKLMDTSLVAGKMELATEMLHNVGNVLNSVNISSEQIKQILCASNTTKIAIISDLLKTHSDDLGTFFTDNTRGKKLPLYIERLSENIDMERHQLIRETESQLEKIKIIADIIRTQQDFSGNSSIVSQVNLASLIEESVEILMGQIRKYNIEIIREYQEIKPFSSQRSKLLQIFLNVMDNAVDALKVSDQSSKQMHLKMYIKEKEKVTIEVTDNGIGMDKNVLANMFAYGFSTKKGGHGFGLHNAANLATQLSGSITATTKGKNCGSSFFLTLPLIKPFFEP